MVLVGAMAEEGKFRVEKFNVQNYQLWKMQIEDYLYEKELYASLGGKEKQPTTIKDEEWEVLDRKSLGTIWLYLVSSMDFNILKEKKIEGVMSALGKLYEKPSASNKVFFMKRLVNMKMLKGGSVADHLNEFKTLNS